MGVAETKEGVVAAVAQGTLWNVGLKLPS
jgi:hypothetical protein